MPSFSRWQVEVKLNAIKFLSTAAVANMIFQAYHLRKSQTALNAGYFAGLCITDDVLQNGMIADNVEGTRSLSRDVQGNLEESTRVLAGIEEATERLQRIGGHVEESVKNLAKCAQALQLEIATLEKTKEESNA